MINFAKRGLGTSTKNVNDILKNYVSVKEPLQRLSLLVSAGLGAMRNPERADLVSEVGDLSSQAALVKLRDKMLANETGRQILQDKPRVTPETWPL